MNAIPVVLKTKRLILRPWRQSDFEPFAQLNADPKVMEFFASTLLREESDQLAKRWSSMIENQGWGYWAVELVGVCDFIGMIGIGQVPDTIPFAPAVEVGWRLDSKFWGQGFAHEGALAALKFGFEQLQLEEIVSFTTVTNIRSRRVMEKLGMHRREEDDFDHLKLKPDHPLVHHVLYRLSQREWMQKHLSNKDI